MGRCSSCAATHRPTSSGWPWSSTEAGWSTDGPDDPGCPYGQAPILKLRYHPFRRRRQIFCARRDPNTRVGANAARAVRLHFRDRRLLGPRAGWFMRV